MNQLSPPDRLKQTQTLITYTENGFTNPIAEDDAYRAPLPCETCTYELTGYSPPVAADRFQISDFVQPNPGDPNDLEFIHIFDSEIHYEETPTNGKQRRLIEQVRTLYRKNDMIDLLALGALESLALPGETYKLAFTPGLLTQVYRRPRDGQPPENLLSDPADVLGGQGADRGRYLASQGLKATGAFPNTDPDDHWWIPAGRVFHSPNNGDDAAQELVHARQHFFLRRRYRDPFGQTAAVTYDAYDLLAVETRDPLDNRVTVGERDSAGNIDPNKPGNDYRVLQPRLVTDPNRNRAEVMFDALGMVAGTAVKGKDDSVGDTLSGFQPDLTLAQVDGFYDVADLRVPAPDLLEGATTRIIYDLDRFLRTRQAHPEDPARWLPVYAAILARETHVSDLLPSQGLKIQASFSYSDGFGREIQKKIQTEPGPLVEGGPVVSPRWVGSGWTIFNNKGKPVRQYEPFFTDTHRFEFDIRIGVSPVLFYDPVERVIATLHPNHTWEKVVSDPWRQETWDVSDTVLVADPKTDSDVGDFFRRLPDTDYLPTWHPQRQGGVLGPQEQAAARKAAIHADTPAVAHPDSLGRTFLTVAHNRFKRSDTDPADPPTEEFYATRVVFDIEGNQREVLDAKDRIVMRYDYDMLGNSIHQASMEAGERWTLNDVSGKPIRAWDSRGHAFRTEYDPLRRPLRSFVTGADPTNPSREHLTERLVYGEQHPEDELRNLRGALYLHLDQAGVVTNEDHDFKGNPLRASRRLAREYKQAINWSAVNAALPTNVSAKLDPAALEAALAPLLEDEIFTSRTTFDALNRPTLMTAPHTLTMPPSVIRPTYNEASLLEQVDAMLRGATVNGEPDWTAFVRNIDYDAKGQRTRIDYGNGASTFYDYDPLTFRLIHLLTRRNAVTFPDDCPQPPPADWPGCEVQNLHYTYDPVGNITHIRDDAQQTRYFLNKRVEPSADYTYDAIYRLIEATGPRASGADRRPA